MKRPLTASILLFAAMLGAYLANGRAIGSGDTLPARHLPWSLLERGRLDVDGFPHLHDETARRTFPLLDGLPYYLRHVNGHYVSAYAPGPAIAALPIYAVPVLLGATPGAWGPALEKLSAAVLTALSVVLLHAAVRRLASGGWALAIALVYGLGTSSLSVSSQGLWQHGPSQLFVALALYGLVRGLAEERFLGVAAFAMAAAAAMRVTDLVLLLPAAAWMAWSRPRRVPRLALWALPPAAAALAYQLAYLGSPLGGGTTAPTWALFSQVPLREGLAGILVSPARGLFVYSPVLLFSLVGAAMVWRRGPSAFRALSLGLPLLAVVVGKWFLWWGGHTWGPRLLADAAPVLCFFLYPLGGPLARRPLAKGAFVALAVVSLGTHALGALCYDGRWDGLRDDDGRLWSWSDGPLAFYGREAMARVGRLAGARGGDHPTSANAPERLAAALDARPIPASVAAGEPMPMSVVASNTGGAVWLASAPDDRGAARLGWRWLRGDREELGGRAFLHADVAPGSAVRLTPRITAPATPGDYALVVDMVSESVTWFAARGSRPIRAIVTVEPLRAARLLSGAPESPHPAPHASVSTDRRAYRQGDSLALSVTLRYPHRPRSFDAYLLLQAPDGSISLYDGRRLAPEAGPPWPAWVKELPLPGKAVGRFRLQAPPAAGGPYRWHVVLTEAGTHRPVARASTAFDVGA